MLRARRRTSPRGASSAPRPVREQLAELRESGDGRTNTRGSQRGIRRHRGLRGGDRRLFGDRQTSRTPDTSIQQELRWRTEKTTSGRLLSELARAGTFSRASTADAPELSFTISPTLAGVPARTIHAQGCGIVSTAILRLRSRGGRSRTHRRALQSDPLSPRWDRRRQAGSVDSGAAGRAVVRRFERIIRRAPRRPREEGHSHLRRRERRRGNPASWIQRFPAGAVQAATRTSRTRGATSSA